MKWKRKSKLLYTEWTTRNAKRDKWTIIKRGSSFYLMLCPHGRVVSYMPFKYSSLQEAKDKAENYEKQNA